MTGQNDRVAPTALTIAGSDSGGGAGIQADLRTFHQWRTRGATAITAVTAQNTLGVQRVHPLPPAIVEAQIASVLDDFDVAAAKTGMLHDREVVEATAGILERADLPWLVVDPVIIAASGDRLLDADALDALRAELLPLASLVCPNGPEAAALTGERCDDAESLLRSARRLVELGAKAALVKGGHVDADEGEVRDVLWDGTSAHVYRRPRIATRHVHGTGCSLSAAVTAALARGMKLEAAVRAAGDWVHAAIGSAPGIGGGSGPINHFAAVPGRPATRPGGQERRTRQS